MKRNYVLVKEELNWADECDFYSSSIFIKEEFEKLLKDIHSYWIDDIEICFGTNEDDYYSKEEFLDSISITEISEEEKEVLTKFGFDQFGNPKFRQMALYARKMNENI